MSIVQTNIIYITWYILKNDDLTCPDTLHCTYHKSWMVRPEAERPSRAQIGRGRQIEPGVEAREEEEDLGVLRSQSQVKPRFFFCASGGLERIILVMRKSFQYQNLHNRLSIVDPNFLPKMHIYRLLRSIALCLLPT